MYEYDISYLVYHDSNYLSPSATAWTRENPAPAKGTRRRYGAAMKADNQWMLYFLFHLLVYIVSVKCKSEFVAVRVRFQIVLLLFLRNLNATFKDSR